jgi:hypothetical protein
MAAGLGFKDFATGEVLTAADVDGYLMQGIWVFASNAARDAAVTAPAEGNFAFTKDTNSLWYYDGAAWVASGATGDIEGVTAGVGISGGGTSGTVTVTNSMATAIDAKGDLIGGTGADTFARLAVGANDTVLTADSSTATGLKWAAAAGGGGMTSIASGSLSGSGLSLTSISGSYKNLQLVIRGVTTTASADYSLTINNNGGSIYNILNLRATATTFSGVASQNGTQIYININTPTAATAASFLLNFYDYTKTTTYKQFDNHATYAYSGGQETFKQFCGVQDANALTRIDITLSTGTFTAGTYTLYGVN